MNKFLLALMGAAACLTASATDYELVTSAGELIPGDNYLIVGQKTGTPVTTYAMGAASTNNKYFTQVAVTLNGTTISINDEAVQPVVLRATTDATYPYQLELVGATTKYLYASSTSGNDMGSTTDATNKKSNVSIAIAESGSAATVKFNNTTKNLLRYNPSSTRFSIYGSGQNDVYLYKEVTAVAEIEKPVFSVTSGNFVDAFDVTISCETADVEIRYTTDGTEPTATSTLYTAGASINIATTTTLKAIALKGDASSAVATAEYTFPAKYTSLAELLQGVEMPENRQNSETFYVNFEPVVTYVNGGNVFVADNGAYSLVYKFETGLNPGDKIKAGWFAHLTNYNGLAEIVPEETLEANGTADVPEPVAFNGMDGAVISSIVRVEGITFADATPGTDATARNFTGTWGADDAELACYNNFKIASVEAGKYNMLAVVGTYYEDMQLQPISYEEWKEPVVEPAEDAVYYVLPLNDMTVADNTPEEQFIPTTFYPWYQMAPAAAVSKAQVGDVAEANVYTLTVAATLEAEAASGGWMASGVNLSTFVGKDYDLVFNFRTTSAAETKVKLVVENQEAKGNETAFTAEHNGEWQTVRMNLTDKFPKFASSGVTTENAYIFSFVAGAGLQGNDTFEFANVHYEPAVKPIAVPDHFYMIGNIDGKAFVANEGLEMTKDENTFTYTGAVTGAGYFGFASELGADESDWTTLNANRWGGANDGDEVAVDTPFELVKSEGAVKMTPGNYVFTVVFADDKVTLTVKEDETPRPVVVPEHFYVFGNFNGNGWDPANSVEMTKDENTFTVTGEVTGDNNFGFATVQSASWSEVNSNRYGLAIDDDIIALDTPVALVQGDGAIKLPESGSYKLVVVFGDNGVTLTATKATAVEGVDADAAAEAVYYNLQGVRVDNPAEGLYIVVRGDKATKEYVK